MQRLSNYNHTSGKQEPVSRSPAFPVPVLVSSSGDIPPLPEKKHKKNPAKNPRTGNTNARRRRINRKAEALYPENERNAHTVRNRRKKGMAEWLITGAIAATALAIAASLLIYFHPFTLSDAAQAAKHIAATVHGYASGKIDGLREHLHTMAKNKTPAQDFSTEVPLSPASGETGNPDVISSLNRTTDLGQASAFRTEPVFVPQEDSIFMFMLDTSLGSMLYYSQGDVRWKDYLYGGQDPISRYGCGPVCVAMIINSFSPTGVSPIEMADWAAANGCYARHGGSYHCLIPDSLSAFGLQVESVTDRSVEHVSELLNSGHILVALMGRGSLTQNGHFIIIAQLCANGNVYIADPANFENCTKEWELQLLMDELKDAYDSGGPLWAVSIPEP